MWKQISGYPNYSVSNNGEIKNNKTGKYGKGWHTTRAERTSSQSGRSKTSPSKKNGSSEITDS